MNQITDVVPNMNDASLSSELDWPNTRVRKLMRDVPHSWLRRNPTTLIIYNTTHTHTQVRVGREHTC